MHAVTVNILSSFNLHLSLASSIPLVDQVLWQGIRGRSRQMHSFWDSWRRPFLERRANLYGSEALKSCQRRELWYVYSGWDTYPVMSFSLLTMLYFWFIMQVLSTTSKSTCCHPTLMPRVSMAPMMKRQSIWGRIYMVFWSIRTAAARNTCLRTRLVFVCAWYLHKQQKKAVIMQASC